MFNERHTSDANHKSRLRFLDTLKGILVISMCLFHLCYDLSFIAGQALPFFTPTHINWWRNITVWLFLLLAGMMCHQSRSNLKRALKYGAIAFLIWLITSLVRLDTPISFGIIFCMAASTGIYFALDTIGAAPKGLVAAIIFIFAFLFLQGLPTGTLWAFGLNIKLPAVLYSTEALSWLGFMGPHFSSGDYYPVLPFSLMFLAGSSLMPLIYTNTQLYGFLSTQGIGPLEYIGRHSLLIYLVHQPLIMAALYLLGLI